MQHAGMDEASSEDDTLNLGHEAATREGRFWALGYREGLDLGKEEVLESSFRTGFDSGLALGRDLGTSQGILTSLQALQGRLAACHQALEVMTTAGVAEDKLLTPASTDVVCKALLHRLSAEGRESDAIQGVQTREPLEQDRFAEHQDVLGQLGSRSTTIQKALAQSVDCCMPRTKA